MLVKKLLVPFINEKILQNAEHVYIATAAISEAAFDFIMSRLPPKCKVEIVTGLDFPTHPNVLVKALEKYPNRVNFRIHTKGPFHANVYIFDLPFRKMAAFIGSGNCTMGGFRDSEELAYKLDTEKAVEEVKVWFRSYFEFAEYLTEEIVSEYLEMYASLKERDVQSRREKQQFTAFVSSGFSWTTTNLKEQYFQEAVYRTFDNRKASLSSQLVNFERSNVQEKLLGLHEQLVPVAKKLKLTADPERKISSSDPVDHFENKVSEMWLAYTSSKEEPDNSEVKDRVQLKVIIKRNSFELMLDPGKGKGLEVFRNEMEKEDYRKKFYDTLLKTGNDFQIDIGGEKHKITSFKTPDQLWQSIFSDPLYYHFTISKTFLPNHPDISQAKILSSIEAVFSSLLLVLRIL